MRHLLTSLTFFLPWFFLEPCFAIEAFTLQTERDLALRHALPVYIHHRLGDVSVEGWVQDRIRVDLKMRVLAETRDLADREFGKLGLITFEGKDRFEIRVGHSRGVDLVSKMRDHSRNPVQVDLQIKAPHGSSLSLVLGEGKRLKLEQWRGGVSVVGRSNLIHLSGLDLVKDLTANCMQCEVEIRQSSLGGRISVGSKPVTLSGVESRGLNIDGGNEEVRIDQSSGRITVHTKSGRLTASRFRGNLQFQSEEGGAYFSQFSGDADIHTTSGQVVLDLDELKQGLNVDTEKGDVQVSLPPDFEGGLDLKSLRGDVIVQFPYESSKSASAPSYGPSSAGQVDGRIGKKARPLIHAYSKQGGVRIIRKVPAR